MDGDTRPQRPCLDEEFAESKHRRFEDDVRLTFAAVDDAAGPALRSLRIEVHESIPSKNETVIAPATRLSRGARAADRLVETVARWAK